MHIYAHDNNVHLAINLSWVRPMGAQHSKMVGLDYEGLLCLDTPCKTIKNIVGGIGTVYTLRIWC
jgi:hypothetical protein